MSRKKKLSTRREIIELILSSLSWQDRKKVEEAGVKYRPSDLAEVERLYYRAHGLTELEIERRMKPMIHELKCWPEFFIRLGNKKVEIRKNDRGFLVGHQVLLKEWSNKDQGGMPVPGFYTGKSIFATITDMVKLSEVPGIQGEAITGGDLKDYVALSLEFTDVQDDRYVFALGYSENVLKLAKEMENELKAHRSKGDHENILLTGGQCLEQLRQQVHELEQAMHDFTLGKVLPGQVLRKAAGVSNYALFCVQVSGAINAIEESK